MRVIASFALILFLLSSQVLGIGFHKAFAQSGTSSTGPSSSTSTGTNTSTSTTTLSSANYSDFQKGKYWSSDMIWAIQKGYIHGYLNVKDQATGKSVNLLKPYHDLTEGQALTVLYRFFKPKVFTETKPATNWWASIPYQLAAQDGLPTMGSLSDKSKANQGLTRGDLAIDLMSLYFGKTVDLQTAVQDMYQMGLSDGYSDSNGQFPKTLASYRPKNIVARAQFVTFIKNLDNYGNQNPFQLTNQSGNVQITNSNKILTLHFNQPLNVKTVTNSTIQLTTSNGQTLTDSLQLTNNNMSVEILPPSGGYQTGETYTVTVTKGITSTLGNTLGNAVTFTLTYQLSSISKSTPSTTNVQAKSTIDPVVLNLTPLEKEIYDGINNLKSTINVSNLTTNMQDIGNALQAMVDRPEFSYFIDYNKTTYQGSGEINIGYSYTKDQINTMRQNIQDAANKIIANNVTPTMSDEEKVRAIHDYIVSHTAYDYQNFKNNTETTDDYNIPGVLLNQTAVCDGYTKTMIYLLNKLGIQTKYVSGMANGDSHSWLKVKLGTDWYNIDATFDDPVPDRPQKINYDYYLVTDSQLAKDHTWDNSSLPVANSTKYSYFWNMENIVQVGNALYYTSSPSTDLTLHKVNLDGTGDTIVINTRVGDFEIYNGWIYYADYNYNGYLFKKKLNGTQKTIVAKTAVGGMTLNGNILEYYDYNDHSVTHKLTLS